MFRLEQRVRYQQDCIDQEFTQRTGWVSEITDLVDWLNTASVKVRATPAIYSDSSIDGQTVQRLISEHKVVLFCSCCDFLVSVFM